MTGLSDAPARAAALDPGRSFIVQAPAGSGKTGLLIQRYLALLATVERPEEIVAITFTRKATGEMRDRVLDALAEARDRAEPRDAHARTTWALARAVLARDARLGWDVEAQPGRLRILTIDALCGWLARHLVLRSGIVGAAPMADDAGALYEEAAAATLGLLEEPGAWSDALAVLLAHLDNDAARLRALLVRMLASRDQWLRMLGGPGVGGPAWRAALGAALERLCSDRLGAVRSAIPADQVSELVAVCAFAGAHLAARDPDHPGAACAGLGALPGPGPEALAPWQGIAALLLTAKGDWRRRFDVKVGFPPHDDDSAAMKRRAADLCAALGEAGRARVLLAEAARLPEPRYAPGEWSVLEALLDVLRVSAATLKVVFAERGELDHPEVAGAARLALGADEAPSDLALALDGRITHLLVDEFQDTSHGQYELLGSLTAGWTAGDGRTLFLVGDPMQSIYRFREADVGLFEHARAHGIAQVALESLVLDANFRSRPDVIEWVNGVFPTVLGARDDPTTGAVAYRPSAAVRAHAPDATVGLHLVPPEAEADTVADLAARGLAVAGETSVAILVRARSHLARLLPALRAAGVAYRGVDIEPLAEVPAVRDLLSLARAALSPIDRVAWLSVLRAPWCGLPLADLHALVSGAPDAPVADLVAARACAGLSAAGAERLERVAPVLDALAAGAPRGRFARRLEAAWQTLGGPACVDAAGHQAAERLLALLHDLGDDVLARGPGELDAQVARLFAESAAVPGAVEVMTMHKAKGLEFDTVILPGLARRPASADRELLEWSSRASGPAAGDLLLAPIPAPGEEPPLYDFVRALEREKDDHESGRLLYVATTRARERLHLVAGVERDEDGAARPASKSLLGLLWPALGDAVRDGGQGGAPSPAGTDPGTDPGVGPTSAAGPWRLPARWRPAPPAPPVGESAAVALPGEPVAGEPVEFDWAGRLARHVGTVVHAVLGDVAAEGIDAWRLGRLEAARAAWAAELRTLGVAGEDVGGGVERIADTVARTLRDPRARWLLDPSHRESASELALSGVVDGAVVRVVLDRTFVDAAGVRWIVDYKTGRHEGGDLERFLDREQDRYRDQLERYGELVGALHHGPVRLALYFPDSGGWREWAPAGTP